MTKCPLCERDLGDVKLEEHHLVPKSRKGKETVTLHAICHRFIHSAFSEKELEKYYNTVERLTSDEKVQNFVYWIKSKDPSFYSNFKDSSLRKSKRKFR